MELEEIIRVTHSQNEWWSGSTYGIIEVLHRGHVAWQKQLENVLHKKEHFFPEENRSQNV